MGGKEYAAVVTALAAKIPKIILRLTDDAKGLTLKLGSVLGVASRDCIVRKPFDAGSVFCAEMDRVLGPRLGIEVIAPKTVCPRSSGFFESILQAAFGVQSPTHQDVQNLRMLLVNAFVQQWSDQSFRSRVWGESGISFFARGDKFFGLHNLVQDWQESVDVTRPVSTLMVELLSRALNIQIGLVSLTSCGRLYLSLYGPFDAPRVYLAHKYAGDSNSDRVAFFMFDKSVDSDFFEILRTLCSPGTYNLRNCANVDSMKLVDFHLSTLTNHWVRGRFEDACSDTSSDFLMSAMSATGLIPVNVEGKGDCFFIAFWYGFSGGDLADMGKCLELRRMVASWFLDQCEKDPVFITLMRGHYAFESIQNESSTARFIEAAFRKISNCEGSKYPEFVHDFVIQFLAESMHTNINVWQIGKDCTVKRVSFKPTTKTHVVHVLYNGRDHYFAFSADAATPKSVPVDCEKT
jgi:hypothetical protein